MVPKNITLAGPEASLLWLGPPLLGFCNLTKPLLLTMKWLARTVLRIWRIPSTEAVKTVFTAEELARLVSQSRTEGLLDPVEHQRITAALALHRRTAGDALRPWAEVTTVSEDVSPASLEVLATRTGRSRFPVVARATRRVLGFVHVKDVLGYEGPQRRTPIPAELIRPLPAVRPERTLADLLLAMRDQGRHIVLVSDGRTPIGIVTLDDVLNAVVGIPDETRISAPSVVG
jgi:CBS domain containing-hemolysin-like protein